MMFVLAGDSYICAPTVDDNQPGLSLAIFSQFCTRHETWAEMTRPRIDYISCDSYVPQQRRDFADDGFSMSRTAAGGAVYVAQLADLSIRFACDFVNCDATLNQLSSNA